MFVLPRSRSRANATSTANFKNHNTAEYFAGASRRLVFLAQVGSDPAPPFAASSS
jgi:hypothetical protein